GSRFSGEGRVITVEFTSFFLVNAYVPNSGQTLDRLDSRTTEWDPQFFTYLKDLEAKGKPVVLTGDLNVAHLDRDIHNPGAKHIAKQAGLTPQERASFGSLLATGFQDALRFFYPDHEGQFTYWSARTNARPVNKGLRLDYFMCSHSLFCEQQRGVGSSEEGECTGDGVQRRVDDVPVPGVLDSYILHEDTLGCSDHCPIMLVMRL
ncbi:ARP, partial [Symbiodinium microadriaticum]